MKKLSARNQLKGKIVEGKKGGIKMPCRTEVLAVHTSPRQACVM